ncbi:hypothetical protein ABIC52_000437 [Curtobacterium oceanosedimentum]
MAVISHVWPGYTLLNIWQVTYRDWIFLRTNAETYVRETRRG